MTFRNHGFGSSREREREKNMNIFISKMSIFNLSKAHWERVPFMDISLGGKIFLRVPFLLLPGQPAVLLPLFFSPRQLKIWTSLVHKSLDQPEISGSVLLDTDAGEVKKKEDDLAWVEIYISCIFILSTHEKLNEEKADLNFVEKKVFCKLFKACCNPSPFFKKLLYLKSPMLSYEP